MGRGANAPAAHVGASPCACRRSRAYVRFGSNRDRSLGDPAREAENCREDG